MSDDVTRVSTSPAAEWGDATLRRRFSNLYADIHVNGLRDGVLALGALADMERELIGRGYDPADVIGPKVVR